MFSRQPFTRRRFFGLAAATGAGAWLPASARANVRRTLDLDDPDDALTAMIKMRGSLIAEDVPHWYYGTIYAVLPGQGPIPLVDFEGSEIDYYERQPDGSYHAYAATASFFRDRDTGKRLQAFTNPFNGERREVVGNTINVKAYYIYSKYGFKRSDDERPLPDEPQIQRLLEWRESGEHVWLTMRRAYPPGQPRGEHQLIRGLLRELHDPDLPKVYTTATPTYVSPYLPWMAMDDLGGHALWVGPARKLDSIEQYPRELLDFVEQHYPDKLTARPSSR
ncbi:MAG: DUF1838 family protein [Chromatiales bacterium]|nr:MAG: DUF1838 family protein [Chromatiales bacterium]